LIERFRPIILSEINYALEWRAHTFAEAEDFFRRLNYGHRVLDKEMWLCWPRESEEKAKLCAAS
jgi:hypothetical protein